MNVIKGIIISLFLIFSLNGFCQDSIPLKPALTIGFDIYGPIYKLFNPSISAYEGSVCYGGMKKYYPTIEAGILNVNSTKDSLYHYVSNGGFVRLGCDYNTIKKKKTKEEYIFFLGCRYGIASLSQHADHIIIKDVDWGDFPNSNNNGTLNQSTVVAQWFELIGGIRAEIFKNFSLGWSVRYKSIIKATNTAINRPMYIPGFGDNSGNTNWTLNYSIFYTFRYGEKK